MSDRTAMSLLIGFFGILTAGVLFAPRVPSRPHGRRLPEQELFLKAALSALEDHHRKFGSYPASWFDLHDFIYSCGGHDQTVSPALHPPASARWRPKGCTLTYVIEGATNDRVLVQAVDDNGAVKYEIEPGMKRPREVDGGSAN